MVKDIDLGTERSTTLFRILQEALTNVARHSGATNVNIELTHDNQAVSLKVEDNGRGITTEEVMAHDSLGLLGIRERAEMIGGHLTLEGKPGVGTLVRVRIPLSATKVDVENHDDKSADR